MFRKHGGLKSNQHIRVIQRLVPRRQHFIHNPIHPSRSISPLSALTPRMFWDICHCSQFFWLMLCLDCILARVYNHSQAHLISWPSLLYSFIFAVTFISFSGDWWIVHIYLLNFFLYIYLKYTRTCPRTLMDSTWNHKEHITMNLLFPWPWGDYYRTLSSREYRKLFRAPGLALY